MAIARQRPGSPGSASAELDPGFTGEDLRTIASMGFVPLTRGPVKHDPEPLVVDWDEVDASREMLILPHSENCL